jgi:transcriptional regulator with XRE-family HTH domain
MTIGNRIRKARESKGYSQEYVATQLGLCQSGYRKIETDVVKLKVDALLKLSTLLDVEVLQLLYRNDDVSPAATTNQLGRTQFDGTYSALDVLRLELSLLKQLLESKDAHIITQQKLLLCYQDENKQLRSSAIQLQCTSFPADTTGN